MNPRDKWSGRRWNDLTEDERVAEEICCKYGKDVFELWEQGIRPLWLAVFIDRESNRRGHQTPCLSADDDEEWGSWPMVRRLYESPR